MSRVLRLDEVLLLVGRSDVHGSHEVMLLPRLVLVRCVGRASVHLGVVYRRLFSVGSPRHQRRLSILLALQLRRRTSLIQCHVRRGNHTFAIRAIEDRIGIR